jgi:hypothetical protein
MPDTQRGPTLVGGTVRTTDAMRSSVDAAASALRRAGARVTSPLAGLLYVRPQGAGAPRLDVTVYGGVALWPADGGNAVQVCREGALHDLRGLVALVGTLADDPTLDVLEVHAAYARGLDFDTGSPEPDVLAIQEPGATDRWLFLNRSGVLTLSAPDQHLHLERDGVDLLDLAGVATAADLFLRQRIPG